MKIILLFLAISLSGCVTAQPAAPPMVETPATVTEPTKEQREFLQSLVRARLKDPNSAIFEEAFFVQGSREFGACVEVNAKNEYGGYTGTQLAILRYSGDSKQWHVAGIYHFGIQYCADKFK